MVAHLPWSLKLVIRIKGLTPRVIAREIKIHRLLLPSHALINMCIDSSVIALFAVVVTVLLTIQVCDIKRRM